MDFSSLNGYMVKDKKAREDIASIYENLDIKDENIDELDTRVVTVETSIGTIANLSTTNKTDIVSAINEVSAIHQNDKTALETSIEELDERIDSINTSGVDLTGYVKEEVVGELTDLSTTDKTNLVSAINEVFTKAGTSTGTDGISIDDVTEITGDVADLSTTDKTNLVSAINEVFASIGSSEGGSSTNGIIDVNDQFLMVDEVDVGIYRAKVQTRVVLGAQGFNVPINTLIFVSSNYSNKCAYVISVNNNGTTPYIEMNGIINQSGINKVVNLYSYNLLDKSVSQTITGKFEFNVLPVSNAVPSTDSQLVNKKYVDSKILSGTTEPTTSQGNNGDIYVMYE